MWILSRRIYNIVRLPTRILLQEIILAHAYRLALLSLLRQRINVKGKVRELALAVGYSNFTYSKDRSYYTHMTCCFLCQVMLAIQLTVVVRYLYAYSLLTLIRLWSRTSVSTSVGYMYSITSMACFDDVGTCRWKGILCQ